MASLETFESTLKEVVRAKRLSASKVKELTDIALKTIENDTKLVSILYRTHKSLTPAHKINSLYAFDALARAARSQVNKHNLVGDLNTEPGNCATFLLKIEGVLDGLFQDMVTTKHPDAKEKSKKILDIWVKGHTFPSDILTRLQKAVKEATEKVPEKESSSAGAATADPRTQAAPVVSPLETTGSAPAASPPPPSVSPPSASAMQSTLLALLSQAASVVAGSGNGTQTVPNTNMAISPPPLAAFAPSLAAAPQLDARQLALFQQLSQVAGNLNAAPVPSIVPSTAPVAPPLGGSSQSQSVHYRDESNGFGAPRDTPYNGYTNGGRGREYHDQRRDPRVEFRGPPHPQHSRDPRGGGHRHEPYRGDFRGGPRGGFRGRGRGRRDDREHGQNRTRWNSPPQGRNPNSRSRSPAGRNAPRRPHDPPPHDVPAPRARSPPARASPAAVVDTGKDEFGRDLRPASPDGSGPALLLAPAPASVPTPAPAHAADTTSLPSEQAPIVSTAGHAEPPASAHAMPPDTAALASIGNDGPVQGGAMGGLDVFDWNTFDYTSPASWESLGRAYNVSHGYMPSQEELMQYFMMISSNMGGVYAAPASEQYNIMQQTPQWTAPPQQQQNWDRGESWRGSGGGRGRGRGYGDYGQDHAYGYEGGMGGSRGRGRGFDQDTDALTLAGGDDTPSYDGTQSGGSWQDGGGHSSFQPPMEEINIDGGGGGSGGRMRKQGDGWVFVKADAS